MSRTLVVTRPADLRALVSGRRPGPRPSRLVLELPGVEGPEKARLERRLSRYYFACGCETAAVATFLALLGLAATTFRTGLSGVTWRGALFGAAIVLAAAGTGKAVGRGFARWRLRRAVADLQHRLGA
jgi:hypothetical protein